MDFPCADMLLANSLYFPFLGNSSTLNIGTKYDLDFKSPNRSGQNFKSGEDMIEMYKELCNGILLCFTLFGLLLPSIFTTALMSILAISEYPIVSIEDPFDKEDWEHIKYFTSLGLCQVCLQHVLIGCMRFFS